MSAIEIGPIRDDEYAATAFLLARIQLATYVGVTPEITHDAMLYHVSGDWAQRKEASFRSVVDSGEASIRVARASGMVVGYCMCREDRYGGALGVDPLWQGGFVGPRLLLGSAEGLEADDDITLTAVPNTPAITFYKRIGFRPTDRDISETFPRLRGGEILPQIELALSGAKRLESMRRFRALLASRS